MLNKMGKAKAEFGTPKWISNNMRSKGLQKLRWYCQMCQKQCRDANGFKCHITSESHQRQLLLFGDNPGKYLASYSQAFAKDFNAILRRQFNQKRVLANTVYQIYISDKNHVHMNATCWVTLTSYVKHLERIGYCDVEDSEKGWYITWKLVDPAEELRLAKLAKKEKLELDDEERVQEYINGQIEKAKAQSKSYSEYMATKLLKSEDEVLLLDFQMKKTVKVQPELKPSLALEMRPKEEPKDVKPKKKEEKRKYQALEDIMEEEKKKKRIQEENDPLTENSWLRRGIVVKVVTKSLGDKYYKKKGQIVEVIDDFAAMVQMSEGGRLRLDQDHLETVVPQVRREVVVLWGKHEGKAGVLRSIDTSSFSASIRLHSGEKVKLPYEQFSKAHDDDIVEVKVEPKKEIKKEYDLNVITIE